MFFFRVRRAAFLWWRYLCGIKPACHGISPYATSCLRSVPVATFPFLTVCVLRDVPLAKERDLAGKGKGGKRWSNADRTFFMPTDADGVVRAFQKWYSSRGQGGPKWAEVRCCVSRDIRSSSTQVRSQLGWEFLEC